MDTQPWLKSYPDGVDHTINVEEYNSIVQLLEESINDFGDQIAYINMGKSMTYNELDTLTRNFASYLQHEAGLKKGDRIAIMMPNLLQYPIAVFGALRAGLVVVNTNPLYTDRELKHQLQDSGAKAIVVVEAFAHTVADVVKDTDVEHIITTKFGDRLGMLKGAIVNFVIRKIKKMVPAFSLPDAHGFNDVLKRGAALPDAVEDCDRDDIAFLQYTGGTTGVAKGAMLTHGNLIANMLQALTWISTAKLQPGKEFIVTALPLYHIFALTANCLVFLKLGAQNLLITNPRDMPDFVKQLGKYPFTVITGVNTLFNGLLNTPGFDAINFSPLKLTLGGGMAVQESVANRWKQVTGTALVEAYGLTETSPAACVNPLNLTEFNGAIGLPLPSTDCCIKNEEGERVGVNTPGELCIKGPQVMAGYWKRPDATDEIMDDEGYLHSGDIAEMNEQGFFKIVDRLKDMILVSGFNVYPNEIEAVISQMPEVLEVGAIGVPDESSGEAVKVIIVKADQSLTEEQVIAHCKEQMTGYKRPSYVKFVEELPKTNVGKILRRELRDLT